MKVIEVGELHFDGVQIWVRNWRFDAEGGSIDVDKLVPTVLKYLLKHNFKIGFIGNEVKP